MIDIHAHILPGVDDGPRDWDEAIATVRAAAAEGITEMVATSHMLPDGPFANTREQLLPLVDELRKRVGAAGLPVRIHAGGEVHISPDLAQRLDEGRVLTYCDARRYMLVEFPPSEIPSYAEHVLFELQLRGVTPVLAHVERNQGVLRNPERLYELIARGALAQVTASSLRGRGAVTEFSEYLIRHRMVHFVATDTHGADRRPPRLSEALETLSQWIGDEAARRLVYENPAALLAGESWPEPDALRPSRRRPHGDSATRRSGRPNLWHRLFRRRSGGGAR